jgi:hypothetical protein
MKRILSHPIAALSAGLLLRLFFVLKHPATAGDTVLYEQMATNWLKHHVYAMLVDGGITPVDLRMPGYPAFLALVYAVTGKVGEAAHGAVMFAQIVVDLATCFLIARIAARLAPTEGQRKHAFTIALWLAATCPFTANYTAVILTESFATFFTALAALIAVSAVVIPSEARRTGRGVTLSETANSSSLPETGPALNRVFVFGLVVGIATLFRPETPIVLAALALVLLFALKGDQRWRRGLVAIAVMAVSCTIPLLPWTVRNAVTLREFQPLAPRNSNLPGELVPYGFMSWEKTWLYRVRDCYLVSWKLDDEPIDVDRIPARAFDTPQEKERVAALLEQYNDDLTLTPPEDAAFAQLARERTARHPLRTYAWLPIARAVTIWFTPRIELLPVSGDVFPLREAWEEDRADQSVTVTVFLVNVLYVAAGLWGLAVLWSRNPAARAALAFFVIFILLRTAFLTTLETPEPRYVLVCFPMLLAMAAQSFARIREHL